MTGRLSGAGVGYGYVPYRTVRVHIGEFDDARQAGKYELCVQMRDMSHRRPTHGACGMTSPETEPWRRAPGR